MSTLRSKVIGNLKERRQRIIDGYVNCIPSPYKRFSNDFSGIEQSLYICVTSFTKGAKSQFVSFTLIFHSLLYAYRNPDKKIDITFLYFPLEETPEKIMQRFMSYLLYELSNGKIRVSPKELRSTTKAVNEEILKILESDEYQDILKYFEERVIFSNESNPTGIMKFCKTYAEKVGKTHTKTFEVVDDFGNKTKREAFDYYELNNPHKYIIPIIDTLNLIDTERGMTLKQSMDKMSEYCAKILRNRYYMSPVVVQQQAFEVEKVDEFKMRQGNIRPSVSGLGDSKYAARDANIVLGLFSPVRFGIKKYLGYNIEIMQDNIRFLEVCVNRDGELGGIVALYFDGACSYFSELPVAIKLENNIKKETEEIKKVYSWLEAQRNQHSFIHTILRKRSKLSIILIRLKKSIKRLFK